MDATFYALVALVLFLGLLVVLKVPAAIGQGLDKRGQAVADELARARQIRAEAEALLAEYARRAKEAESEAAALIEAAKADAERLTAETNKSLEDMIARRTRAAESKIAQAEAQAVADVRTLAVDLAIAASAKVLGDKVAGGLGARLVSESIAEARAKLN
jgi:F-type H+-transporting ATPase subunit b